MFCDAADLADLKSSCPGVTQHTTSRGATRAILLNTRSLNLVIPPLHSDSSRKPFKDTSAHMSAHMRQKIYAVLPQPVSNATASSRMVLSPRSADMATRSATIRLAKRRAELDKLQTASQEFKAARSVVPRGTGLDKLWFTSGQHWGKAYTIGLILKHEGLPIAADDPCFQLPSGSKQKRVWEEMQAAPRAPSPEQQPRKKPASAVAVQ